MLYEVALIQQPTKTEIERGVQEKLILPPTPVIAKDEQSAGVIAVMKNKDEIKSDLDRIQVLVRPFA
jgi:sensor histidine kinase regulating citrate/malate metabolism